MSEAKFTPGPWVVGYKSLTVGIPENAKIGGFEKLFDVRGWGYFTGLGHGAIGMTAEDATVMQDANAHLIAAAPELYEALAETERYFSDADGLDEDEYDYRHRVRSALAKARGEC